MAPEERICDHCGVIYVAIRPQRRYCSDRCRARANQGLGPPAGSPRDLQVASVTPLPTPERDEPDPAKGGPTTRATLARLERAEVVDTPEGASCLALAARIDSSATPAAALASLVGRLETSLASAVRQSEAAAAAHQSYADELAARRARRGAG